MFDKISKWFNGKPSSRNSDSSESELDTSCVAPSEPSCVTQAKTDTAPTSEFAIRYNRNKGSVPRLSAIGRELFVSDAKADVKLDTMAVIIHCARHETVAVYEDPNSGIRWLPFTPTCPGKTWTESATLGTLLILSSTEEQYISLKQSPPFKSVQLLENLRIQLPQTLNILSRMIFYVRLTPMDSFACCGSGNSIAWISTKELAEGAVTHIWGPELVQYMRIVNNNFEDYMERIEEFSLDDVYMYSPREPPRNAEETMLLELGISEKTIEILYNDFLDHCFPCFSLPIYSFKQYMSRYGFRPDDERLDSLFIAFNYKKNGYVSFHELLMGLVALEPQASHQETRIKFIFRFYDNNSKGYLSLENFAKLVSDMNPSLEGNELQAKLEECSEAVEFAMKDGQRCVTFAKLMEAIASLRLRGSSRLCRSNVPVFLQITMAYIRRRKPTTEDLREWKDLRSVLISRSFKGTCKGCRHRKFKLATHVITIEANGYPSNPVRIVSKENRAAPTDRNSVELVFNPKSICNTILNLVRQFAKHKGAVRAPRGLLDGSRGPEMYDLLVRLAKEVKPILKAESRCPNVCSPVYVIGDIHGNIDDLLTLEKILWRSAPCFGAGFLFLGDYVDRGKWGFECAVYLFALKLMDPKKITLLRGNHEIRSLQEKYSYKRECIMKYGPETGDAIWQLTNELFDLLPLAATIDEKIFCVHGGLSAIGRTLEQIKSMPVPLTSPELQSKLAWDLVWSDPCHMQQYLDIMDWSDINSSLNEYAHEGFVYNARRGAAYLFNQRAAESFLERNGLTHIIRAHEVPICGYTHHFGNKCTTVFSCSHYCGNANECAVILISQNRIRVVRIDTHNNAPATDGK